MVDLPKVSVLMPVYNGAAYLQEAIESILKQTFSDFELCIIDDGSTDNSVDVASSFSDSRIVLHRNPHNLGIVPSRNQGVRMSRGEYIAMMDCDDISYPERLEKQVSFLEGNRDFGMVGAGVEIIDDVGRLTGQKITYDVLPEKIPSLLLFNNIFAQSAMLVRTELLRSHPYRKYPVAEDYDLWIRLTRETRAWNLRETLVKYRVHSSGVSSVRATEIETYVREIIRSNLNNLGVIPSENELDIHRKIESADRTSSGDFLEMAEAWLMKLLQANRSVLRYNPPLFEEVVGMKWYYLCKAARVRGLNVFFLFIGSPLGKMVRTRLVRKVYLLLLCLIKSVMPRKL